MAWGVPSLPNPATPSEFTLFNHIVMNCYSFPSTDIQHFPNDSNLVAEVTIYWCSLNTFHGGSQFCFWKEDDWRCLFKTWLHRTDRQGVWAFLRTTFSTKMNDWMKSLGTQKQRPNGKIKLHPAIFLRTSLSFRPLNWLNCWNCLKIWTKMTSLLVILILYSTV